MTILSLAFDLPDTDVVTERLLRNATDMGNLLKPYYGNQIAEKYSNLIKNHLIIAATLVKAAKANNQQAATAAEQQWYANGEQIVAFLSAINPYIQKSEFRKMFYEHLAITKAEATAILEKKYQQSITIFNQLEGEALQMADTITLAIVQQYYHYS